MCGIVGLISKNGNIWGEHDDLFQEMLYVDAVRGMDSTGAFMVNHKNQVQVVKQAIDPGTFTRTKSWKAFKSEITKKARVVIGHNRKATFGAVTSKNAHPFVDKGIVLVHNGYIGNARDIDASKEVDSETIIEALDKVKDPIEAIRSLTGAFAIIWYNHRTRKLYMTRNRERPLFMSHGHTMLYTASEGQMIQWLLNRRRLHHETPVLLKEDEIYEITLDNFAITSKTIPAKVVHQGNWSRINTTGLIDDDDVPVLGPTPQKPADWQATGHTARDLLKLYPQDSLILFQSQEFFPSGTDTITVRGRAWVPGKDSVPASYQVKKKNDKEEYLNYNIPLVAHVSAVMVQNTAVVLLVKDVRLPHERFKDIAGQHLGAEEWHDICEKFLCEECAKPLMSHEVEFTAIGRKSPGVYECVCKACTNQLTAPKVVPVADDKTDKPTINT